MRGILSMQSLSGLLKKQILYIALSGIVASFFWGNGDPVNPLSILLYSLCIGNFTMLVTEGLQGFYVERPFPFNWLFFLPLVTLLSFPVYALATVIVWWLVPSGPQSLSQMITTGWKFPVVATFVFSVALFLYRSTKTQLEQRNIELQHSVEKGAQQLEMQAQEMRRAREIQQSLLPKEIPQLAGFEIAAAWRPAREVSGDYYDVFRLNEHCHGICIADVSGKGVAASLLMANVQAAVRAYASSAENAAQLCTKVNRLLCENLATGKFVTFMYGVLDNEKQTFDYCNAGNIYPIFVSQGTARSIEAGGAALGVFPEWEYEHAAVALKTGDRLLLVTDGISEAADADELEFGEEKLAESALRNSKRSAVEMSRLLLEEVSAFCGSRFHDDATLLVIAAK